MASTSPRPASFADRIKSRTQSSEPAQSIKIVDEENDFPFEFVDYVRVGSAHAACTPTHDAENIDLMLRLSTHTMRRYEPDLLPAKVTVEYKSDKPATASCNEPIVHTLPPGSVSSTSNLFESTFIDRRWIKGLYLCVLAEGQLDGGVRGYAYFGVFADTFVEFIDRYQPSQPFNPNQLKAIVLARSTGEPTIEVREFMRMKFSFDYQLAVLEISRAA